MIILDQIKEIKFHIESVDYERSIRLSVDGQLQNTSADDNDADRRIRFLIIDRIERTDVPKLIEALQKAIE